MKLFSEANTRFIYRDPRFFNNLSKALFLIWSFTIFFSQLNIVFYLFCFACFLKIISFKEYRRPIIKKENLPFFLIIAYVLWSILSLIYSENFNEGLRRIEKLIPLVLISLIGLFTERSNFSFNESRKFYLYGALFSIIVSLGYVFFQFFNGYYKAVATTKGIAEINFLSFFEHRLYIGVLLLMMLPDIIRKVLDSSTKLNNVIWSLVLMIVFFVIYSTGARILILTFTVILIFLIFKQFKKRISPRLFYPILLVFSLLLISIIYFHPRTNLTLYLFKNNKELHKIDSRVRTWESSYEVWNENFLFGTGIGDAKKELLQNYKSKSFLLEYEKEYNAHNQFLETSMQSGIIGLIFLCSIFISLIYVKKNNIYNSSFLIIVLSSFLIESFFSRNLGTFYFSYWIFAISMLNEEPIKKIKQSRLLIPKTFIFSFLLIILTLIYFNKRIVFDPKNPQTYLTVPFKQINHNSIPQKSQLPEITMAGAITSMEIFRDFEYGYFLAPEIFTGEIDENLNIDFGLWCYVSDDSNIRRLFVYGWDKISKEYKLNYNFDKRGSWQFLKLSNMEFSGRYSVGVRLDLFKETKELKGKVLIALPYYKVEKNYNTD